MSESTVVEVEARGEALFTREFVLLLATQVCFGMSFSSMFLLPKYLKLELSASDAQIGAVQAAGALAGVLTFPVIGALNDRVGRRPFLTAGSLLMTVVAFATLGREVDVVFYVLRVVQGAAFAMFFNSAATLTADQVAPSQLGRALAVFGASMLATNALAPAIAEPVAHAYGFDWLFVMAVAWGIVSFVLGFWVRERRARTDSRAQAGVLSLLATPRGRAVGLLMAATGAGFGTVFTFHQPYALSLHITRVSGFFICYAASALVVRLGLMRYLEGHDRLRVSAWCMLLYAVGVAATAWLRPGMLEVVGAILGTAQGIFYPVFNAVAVESVPPAQRGSMMALYHGGFNAGTALLMFAGGRCAEALGYPALFLGTAAITAVGALSLLGTRLFHPPA